MKCRIVAFAPALTAMFLAMPAAAQDVIVEPEPAAVAAEQRVPPAPPFPVFYEELDYDIAPVGFDLPWYEREGADEPFDTDPRDVQVLPQPQPLLSITLR